MIWRNRCLLVLQNSKIQALPIQLGWNGSLIHFRVSRGPRCSSNLEDVIHCIVNSRTSVFEPQKNQFDYGYMRMEALRRLRVSSLDQSPRIFCPMWLRPQPSGWVTLEYERFCLYGDKGVLQLLPDKMARECRPEGQNLANSTTSVTNIETSEQWSRGASHLHSAWSC